MEKERAIEILTEMMLRDYWFAFDNEQMAALYMAIAALEEVTDGV